MARNVAGFGEGLAQGFGLVNKFYDSQRSNELDQEQIDIARDYREGQVRNTAAKLEINQKNTNRVLGIEETKAEAVSAREAREGVQAETNLIKEQQRQQRLDLTSRRINDELDAQEADRERRITAGTRREQTTNNYLAAQDALNYWRNGRTNPMEYDDKVFGEMIKGVGGLAGFDQYINPINVRTMESFEEQMQIMASGGQADERTILDMGALALRDRDLAGLGTIVTEGQNPSAPDYVRGWEIVSKQPVSMSSSTETNEDGTQSTAYSFGVDVTVRDPDTGRTHIYTAGMTEGGDGEGISPQVKVSAEDLMKVAGAYLTYASVAKPMAGQIQKGRIQTDTEFETRGRYDDSKYNLWMSKSKKSFRQSVKNRMQQESDIPGKTNQDLIDDERLLESHLLSERYDPLSNQRQVRKSNGNLMIDKINTVKEVQALSAQLEQQGEKPLSRANLLRMQEFVTRDATNNFILDPKYKKQFQEFRRDVLGLKPYNRYRAPGRDR